MLPGLNKSSALNSVPKLTDIMREGQGAVDSLAGSLPTAPKVTEVANTMRDMFNRLFDRLGFPVALPPIPPLPPKPPLPPGLPKLPPLPGTGTSGVFDLSKVLRSGS